jgi:hypothetical protein
MNAQQETDLMLQDRVNTMGNLHACLIPFQHPVESSLFGRDDRDLEVTTHWAPRLNLMKYSADGRSRAST